jgi:hypothetical protein
MIWPACFDPYFEDLNPSSRLKLTAACLAAAGRASQELISSVLPNHFPYN